MKNVLALCAMIVMTLVLSSTAAISGADIQKDVPISGYLYNPCCDEYVAVSGLAHVVMNKNSMHMTVGGMTGVGYTVTLTPTGNAYTQVGNYVHNMQYNSNANGQWEESYAVRYKMRGTNGCSFTLAYNMHLTLNANGTLTANVENLRIICE